jgi:hypothetical protein
MKMDAMQKKKMRKVAFAYFVLTFLPVFVIAFTATGFFRVPSAAVSFDFWVQCWFRVFIFLQPVFCLFESRLFQQVFEQFMPDWLWPLISVVVIPIWCNFIGWIFVRGRNWLNHFPVLGKKVF